MGYDLIAGQDALESVGKRALKDAWAFLQTPPFYVSELALTAGAAVVLSTTLIYGANVHLAIPAIAPFTLPAITLVVVSCRALFAQRNEARKEVLETRVRLKPKVDVGEVLVQELPMDYRNPSSTSETVRVRIVNDSDSVAEMCSASILDMKPELEWLPFEEEGRSSQIGNLSPQFRDVPFPVPLRWTADGSGSSIIPARGDSLIDVFNCRIERSVDDAITLASTSTEIDNHHRLPVTDVVFTIRIDSKDCLPIFCVGGYKPEPLMGELKDQCVIRYLGTEHPNLDDYRQFRESPRPRHWD